MTFGGSWVLSQVTSQDWPTGHVTTVSRHTSPPLPQSSVQAPVVHATVATRQALSLLHATSQA
jgi:hypothetical protein